MLILSIILFVFITIYSIILYQIQNNIFKIIYKLNSLNDISMKNTIEIDKITKELIETIIEEYLEKNEYISIIGLDEYVIDNNFIQSNDCDFVSERDLEDIVKEIIETELVDYQDKILQQIAEKITK